MQKKSLLSLGPNGFHKISYIQWGNVDASRTIVCVHGLTRNSRDFDMLAQKLLEQINARIICPDLPGRGDSDWFSNAKDYKHEQYLNDLCALIARLDVEKITWIGTSMGGLLGMYLAAQSNTPIEALILNDIGPVIPHAAISRISKYSKSERSFKNFVDAKKYLQEAYSNGGELSDQSWQHIAEHSVIQKSEQDYRLKYDPKLTGNMPRFIFWDIKLWDLWERIKCPVLALRGEHSDVLLPATAQRMQSIGPKTDIATIANCGHAPMLMTIDQISIICNWLKKHSYAEN